MTAITAVIALSSTPLLAQATTDAAPATPVVAAPPVADVSAPPAVAQTAPEAAAPVAPAPVDAAPAPAPAMRTMSTPVEHTVAEASDETPARAAPVARTAARSIPARATVPAAAKPAPASTERTSEPASPAPVISTPAPTESAPAPAPAPIATATRSTTQQSLDSDALPMAGIVGLGVIAIGGVAFALRRKRREDDEDELLLDRDNALAAAPVARAPVAEAAVPIVARTVSDRAAPAPAARTLPNGFDLSRFGRHTQAAYRGPTPDNPSHSLKRRLKHASFFDQREREAAEAGSPRDFAGPAYPAQAAKANQDGQVTIRMAPQRNPGSFGYVLQK
jgi:hypothetical protein